MNRRTFLGIGLSIFVPKYEQWFKPGTGYSDTLSMRHLAPIQMGLGFKVSRRLLEDDYYGFIDSQYASNVIGHEWVKHFERAIFDGTKSI